MTDEELIARMRVAGAKLRRRPGDLDREAGWLMKWAADRLGGRAGQAEGRSDLEGDAACPDHRPVHDSVAGWYCAACGSDAPPV